MGKRKRKNSASYIRNKIRRLENKLRNVDTDSSSGDDSESKRYYAPASEHEIPISDSCESEPSPRIRSIISPMPGPSNEFTVITPVMDHKANSTLPDSIPGSSIEAPGLPTDILEALGDPKYEDEKFGPKIPEEIAKRWGRILTDGLLKEQKQEIPQKVLVPENFRLAKAPLLNPEVVPVLSDAARIRDRQLEKYQNLLGLGISGLTDLAVNVIDGNTDKIQLLTKISEVSKIFLDLHYEETNRRRKLVTSALDKKFLRMITGVKRDEYLFGANLGEKIRASKTAERSGLQIKSNENSVSSFRKYPQQGNWRGPPRTQASRASRQGGPRNRYPPQSNWYAPPTQDRQARTTGKANAALTKTRKN